MICRSTPRPGWSFRKLFLVGSVAAFLTALSLTALPGPSLAASEPDEFLVDFGRRAVAEVNDPERNKAEREQRFRELFNEAVDVKTISRFILGRSWRSATEDERAGFLSVFEDMAIRRLLPMFTRGDEEYQAKGKGFEVVDIKRGEGQVKHVFVHTEVIRENGAPAAMVWRLKERDGRFKIIDITIEGISMALTLRHEYTAAVQRLGGVGGLVKELRGRLEEVAAPGPESASK